jgi:UDP-N-acetylmuramoyl-tripeptide--D-alanyl-D-alanine ligase
MANPFVEITFSNCKIVSNLIGLYNSNNINAAITIGTYFQVSISDIKAAIESFVPENNRSQLLNINTNEIILDAYNANPSSMAVAIENFIQLKKTNKIAVLGVMFVLGEESLSEHQAIVSLLLNESSITTFFIGKDFYSNKIERENCYFFENFEVFSEAFAEIKFINCMILIKGSRGMALERTLQVIS